MKYLNLIPPERIKLVKRHLVIVAVEQGLTLLAVVLAVNVAILILARMLVVSAEKRLVGEQEKISAQYVTLNRQVEAANREIAALSGVAKNFRPTAALYHEILKSVPAGVTLTAVGIDYLNNKARVAGRAESREILISFQKTLEKNERFASVRAPLSNIALRENIPFEYSLTLKP